MATASLTLSGPPKAGSRFARSERTEIRAHFAREFLADMKGPYFDRPPSASPWIVRFSGLSAQAGGKDSTAVASDPATPT